MSSVTLLDGGMGQELVRRSGKTPSPLWSTQVMLETPELVEQLHLDFIRAGSKIITVNSYTATPERLADNGQGDNFEALQQAAFDVAKNAKERSGESDILIAGCLPPLVASYHPEIAPEESISIAHYRSIVNAQKDVDLFICETMASVSEARYAATAALESGKPVWVALTLDDGQPACLRSGEPWQDAADTLEEMGVDALLLNCSRPESIDEIWEDFSSSCTVPVGAYANGFTSVTDLKPGGTVASLETRLDLGPDAYAAFAMKWIEQGATIIGGCCEVGPDHIAKLDQEIKAL